MIILLLFYFTYIPHESSGLLQILYIKYIVDSLNVSTESPGLLQVMGPSSHL